MSEISQEVDMEAPTFASLALLLATAAVAGTAPIPPDRVAEYYYVTHKGTELIYETDGKPVSVEVLDAKSEEDGVTRVWTESLLGGETKLCSEELEVSRAGVARVVGSKGEKEWLLKTPAKRGDTWLCEFRDGAEFQDGSGTFRAKYTVRGEEWVNVPTGRFKAIRVDREYSFLNIRGCQSDWFAAGVGIVKTTNKHTGGELKTIMILTKVMLGER